jgi:hypothetical protein
VTPKNTGTNQILHWTAEPGGPWVSVSPLDGNTPSPLTITPVNYTQLPPASYAGSLILTVTDPPDTAGSPTQIPLMLHVVERLYPVYFPLIIR